jgi:hypothetical protein
MVGVRRSFRAAARLDIHHGAYRSRSMHLIDSPTTLDMLSATLVGWYSRLLALQLPRRGNSRKLLSRRDLGINPSLTDRFDIAMNGGLWFDSNAANNQSTYRVLSRHPSKSPFYRLLMSLRRHSPCLLQQAANRALQFRNMHGRTVACFSR